MESIYEALCTLRAPLQQGEYDLHRLVMDALTAADIPFAHEVKLGPRCRIDLMCGGVGIEVKRGKLERTRLLSQLGKYAECDQVEGIILVTEKTVRLPHTLRGKPVMQVCLNRLWGIAL